MSHAIVEVSSRSVEDSFVEFFSSASCRIGRVKGSFVVPFPKAFFDLEIDHARIAIMDFMESNAGRAGRNCKLVTTEVISREHGKKYKIIFSGVAISMESLMQKAEKAEY